MLLFNRNQAPTLQGQIDAVIAAMGEYREDSEEHEELLTRLERLYKLKASNKKFTVSGDAILGAAVSVGSIIIILHGEQIGRLMSSSAKSFIPKIKS